MQNLLQQLLIQAILATQKMDICFYNSLEKVKTKNKLKFICHLVSTIIIFITGLFILVQKENSEFMDILIFILAIFSQFSFTISRAFYHSQILNNTKLLLIIAKQLNHTVQQPQEMHQKNSYVSAEMYNAVTDLKINDPALTQQICSSNETQNAKIITIVTESAYPCFKCCIPMINILAGAYFVMAIVKLAQNLSQGDKMQTIQIVYIVFLSLLIVIGGINCIPFFIKMLVVVLGLALILFLCIRACCCCCCFPNQIGLSRNGGGALQNLPEPRNGTQSFIQSIGDSCSICKMDFDLGHETITLRCNQKHIFHKACIQRWVMMKPDCPTCRTPI